MTPEQFCYWLQGFCELNPCPPNDAQWQAIRDHLQTVFAKVTPTLNEEILRELAKKRFSGDDKRYVSPSIVPHDWQKPVTVTC